MIIVLDQKEITQAILTFAKQLKLPVEAEKVQVVLHGDTARIEPIPELSEPEEEELIETSVDTLEEPVKSNSVFG